MNNKREKEIDTLKRAAATIIRHTDTIDGVQRDKLIHLMDKGLITYREALEKVL